VRFAWASPAIAFLETKMVNVVLAIVVVLVIIVLMDKGEAE
jgi:preprotein translocase subunit SecG